MLIWVMASSLPFVYRHNRPFKWNDSQECAWNDRIIAGDLPMFNVSIIILNNNLSNKDLDKYSQFWNKYTRKFDGCMLMLSRAQ